MANDSSVFPLVLSITEDGSIEAAMAGFEQSISQHTSRAAGGFKLVRQQVDELNRAAAQRIADPLGIQASMRAISLSPVQKVFDQFAAGSTKAAQSAQQARAQAVAAMEQQTAAALAGIKTVQAARSAAVSQAAREADAAAARARQQTAELAQQAAAPQRVTGVTLDPAGIARAAAAARAFAAEQDAIAVAAERSAAAVGRAAIADRGYAIAARQAADAAGAEALRLEGQAAVHARVAQQVATAGVRLGSSGALVTTSAGQQRIGLQQLGFQLNDVATQFASGTRASVIFAQQSGQVIQALQLMGGSAKGVLGFLGGPWGIALTTAAVVLSPFVAKLFDTSDAAKKAEAATKALASQVSDIGAFFDQTTGKITETNRALVTYAILSRQKRNDELRAQQVGNAKAGGAARSESLRDLARAFAERGLGGDAPRGRVNLDVDNALRSRDRDAALLAIARSKSTNAAAAQRLIEQRALYSKAAQEIAKNDREVQSLLSGQLVPSLRRGGTSASSGRVAGGGAARSGAGAAGADATGEAKRQAEALAATLASVAGRYDAVRAAAIAYGKEIADIGKLETAGPDKGGISVDEAAQYRAAAAAARDKAIAEARARAAEQALTPIQRATAELDQQLEIARALADGDERRADILQLQQRLLQGSNLSAAQARDLAIQQVDAEDALAARKERTYALIQAQVEQARRLQGAFEDFFAAPFKKGALSGLSDALTKSRQQAIAEQISIKLFGGDLGSRVHDALTRNSQPLRDAANRHVTAADALLKAAGALSAAAARPANDNAPTLAQLGMTPTAFPVATARAVAAALPGEIVATAATGRPADVITAPDIGLIRVSTGLTDVSDQLSEAAARQSRNAGREQAATIALSYAAQAVGGKGGAAINSVLTARDTVRLGADIAKGLGGKLGGIAGGAVAGLGVATATNSVLNAIGIKLNQTGSAIGGTIGGAAFGPLGAIGGSVLGGLVGNLFAGKARPGGVTVSNQGGAAGIGGSVGSDRSAIASGNDLGGQVAAALNNIVQQLGGTLGYFSVQIGKYKDDYRVNVNGRPLGGVKGSNAVGFGDNAQAAVAYAVQTAIAQGAVAGLRAGTQRLIQMGGDVDRQLQKALSFEGVFTQLRAIKDPIGAANEAIDKELTNLRAIFTEAGASVTENAQLEELYALKRSDALKQAEAQISGQLRNFAESLAYKGDAGLSLRTREQNALTDLSPLIAKIQAGKTVDQDAFTGAAQAYLDIERQLYGSTNRYFDALSNITGLTKQAIANTGAGNVTSISDAVAKAADAAAQAAQASTSSFSIPEDRVAMMTSGQFTSAVEAGMTAQTQALILALNANFAAQTKALSVAYANDDGGNLPFVNALRNA